MGQYGAVSGTTRPLLTRPQLQIDWASNPNIRPVCLPDADAGDYDQLMATVTGQHEHGYDEHDGDNCDADGCRKKGE